ncbi:MAG: hypothetical protein AB1449_07630 [Chloroflexota bacterium]
MPPLRTLLAIVLALTLAACAGLPGTPPTPGTSTAPPRTPEVSPNPTPIPTQPQACAIPAGTPPVPDLATTADPAAALLEYFNAGGSADRLEPAVAYGPLPADVDGDGWIDWLVIAGDPSSQTLPPGGTLWLLTCSGSAYDLSFRLAPTDRGAPILHGVADLTGDGAADVLLGLPLCGAHTCFEQAQALVWNGATLENRLQGTSDDLPYPSYSVTPAGPGEPGRVEIRGTGIGSVGAGPYRPVARTWSWDSTLGSFIVIREESLPSNFRIHVLLDADRADQQGNYTLAHDLYYRVITNDGLDDWEAGETGRENLSAYAMFRQVLSYLHMGDSGDAQVVYGILQGSYPTGATGHAYAELAQAFWEEYGATGDVAAACLAAQAYAEAHPVEILEPLYYGYANPAYTAQDICPTQP